MLTQLWRRHGYHAAIDYRSYLGAGVIRPGDELRADLAGSYRLWPEVYDEFPSPQINLFLELNGKAEFQAAAGGSPVADSGRTTVFVSPGIQYVASERWLVDATVQVPVFEQVAGAQLDSRWVAGKCFSYLLD